MRFFGKYLAQTSGQGDFPYTAIKAPSLEAQKIIEGNIWGYILSMKLTNCPWKWMVGILVCFLLGRSIFRHCVSFRECRWWFQPIWKICSSKWIISPGVKIKRNWTYPLNLLVDVQWLQVPKVFPLNSDSHVKGSIFRITKVQVPVKPWITTSDIQKLRWPPSSPFTVEDPNIRAKSLPGVVIFVGMMEHFLGAGAKKVVPQQNSLNDLRLQDFV